MAVVTRFAPSPTGYLHIGGLRTALFNYLYARQHGGKFFLRIEDTDMARNSKEATQAIIQSFSWIGLEHDGEIIYQSERFNIYKRYAKQLVDEQKAYYCYMSKEELEALREAQKAQGITPRYDNRYRDFHGIPPADIAPVIRIKAPLEGEISFHDGVKGRICVKASTIDDFIILRSDGSPTYNFVVAIDDALMGVTDVIRGDDHTSNTPKQILIYEALGFALPMFYHIPMILNSNGKKLSKRDGAMGVMDYKDMGYLPEALLNFLVRLGWSYEDREIFSLDEMCKLFHASAINSSASHYNPEKLLWLNHHYIKECDHARLEELLRELDIDISMYDKKAKSMLLHALQERSKTLRELARHITHIQTPPSSYDKAMLQKLDSSAISCLQTLLEDGAFARCFNGFDTQSLESYLHHLATSCAIKVGKLMIALRLALLGGGGGIGICEALLILGLSQSLSRIKHLLQHIKM